MVNADHRTIGATVSDPTEHVDLPLGKGLALRHPHIVTEAPRRQPANTAGPAVRP
jgi:hypothetical protein